MSGAADHIPPARPGFTRADWAVAFSAAAVALVVYVRTLAPALTGEDSGEFIVSAYALGIPHPPGYPLWCMLAHLFTWLPFGSVAWQVNFSSAFFAAAAAGVTALLIIHLTRDRLAALGGALALAFSREFWEQAIIAEAYALNAFLLAVCLLLVWRWHAARERRLLYALAVVFGASLGNHNTIVIAGPMFALYILLADTGPWPARARCYGFGMLIAAVAALAVYAYLPLASRANPPMDWGNPETLKGWWDHATRKQFAYMFSENPRSAGRFLQQLWVYAGFWWREFTPWIAVAALAGLAALALRKPFQALFTFALGFATVAGFSFVQNFDFDKEWLWVMSVFGIPLYMMTALWLGEAIAWTRRRAGRPVAAFVLAAVCVASPLLAHWRHNDKSDYYWAHDYAVNILGQLAPHAALFSAQDHVSFGAVYLQAVEGFRPDVLVGRRYGYLAPEVLAQIPSREHNPAWGGKPARRHDPEIFAAFLRHTDTPVYFTHPPRLPASSGVRFEQEGLVYRALRPDEDWSPDPDIWASYRWHTLACEDTRGDDTAEVIVSDYHLARAAELLRAGDAGDGLAEIERAIACYGPDVRIFNNAGALCARHGLLEEAERYFERAVEALPGHETAAANLERVRRLRGHGEAPSGAE